MDPSINAVEAGDYTLAMTACGAAPGGGLDICRVNEKDPVTSVWTLILPSGTLGGELDVSYKDVTRAYAVAKGQAVVKIPFADIIGHPIWELADDGQVLAVGKLRYINSAGVEQEWFARGLAELIVTKQGYAVLPLDGGGYTARVTTCKISYSTAGRSGMVCK